MMKEIRFWVTLMLLVLTVGYVTCRQFHMKDTPLQEIPEAKQDTPSETANRSVYHTEIRAETLTAAVKETLPASPAAEISDEKPVYSAAISWLPMETITEIPETQQEVPSETVNRIVLPTERRAAAAAAGAEKSLPESPGTEISDETLTYNATMSWLPAEKITEIQEKLEVLSELSEDLTGWIYIADTDIDYPVVKGEDNQFYLNHAPDRKQNWMGSIFLDRQCSRDFSGKRSILYGHNFQQGMFGVLRSFKERQNYDAHPYGWLFTTDAVYRIEFFSLVIVPADDQVYLNPADSTAWQNAIEKHSLYCTGEIPQPEEQCIGLSTCASDFEDARELLIGRMLPYDIADSQ